MVVITGELFLKRVRERGSSKHHHVKTQIFPSENNLEEIDKHVGAKDITNGINWLISVKEIIIKVKQTNFFKFS